MIRVKSKSQICWFSQMAMECKRKAQSRGPTTKQPRRWPWSASARPNHEDQQQNNLADGHGVQAQGPITRTNNKTTSQIAMECKRKAQSRGPTTKQPRRWPWSASARPNHEDQQQNNLHSKHGLPCSHMKSSTQSARRSRIFSRDSHFSSQILYPHTCRTSSSSDPGEVRCLSDASLIWQTPVN